MLTYQSSQVCSITYMKICFFALIRNILLKNLFKVNIQHFSNTVKSSKTLN